MDECWPRTLQHGDTQKVRRWVLDRTRGVRNLVAIVLFVHLRMNDLISVAHYRQIRVVRDDDNLTPASGFTQTGHQHIVDRLVVQVVLRLIDDEWNITAINQ